jgi:hypothetical protein
MVSAFTIFALACRKKDDGSDGKRRISPASVSEDFGGVLPG